VSLGNEKPEFLGRVEKSLWSTFLSIATGAPAKSELQSFIAAYNTMAKSYSPAMVVEDWYNRECLLEPFLHLHIHDII